MAEQLEIKVGADVSQATKALSGLQTTLDKTGKATAKTGKDFTGLSRVIQDLPYGFQGISNNLTQLIPAAGAAGLAFSALVAGLSFAQIGLRNWVRGNKEGGSAVKDHAEKVKEIREAMEKYVAALNEVERSRVVGAQQAQAELGSLQTLYQVSQDLSISYGERKKAVDLLQERYPAYFKNLSDESILAGKAEGAYKKLTAAIIAGSKARAAQKELDQLAEDSRVVDKQLEDARKVQATLDQKAAERAEKNNKAATIAKKTGESTLAFEIGIQNANADAGNYRATTLNPLIQQSNQLLEKQKKLSEEITNIVKQNGVTQTLTDVTAKVPKEKVEKAKKEIEERFGKLTLPINFEVKTPKTGDATGAVSLMANPLYRDLLDRQRLMESIAQSQIERAQVLGDTISTFITPAFQGMFDAIFEGTNVINGFFSGIAAGLKGLIGKMVAALAQALALKAALSLIPGLGVAAGISKYSSIGKIFGKMLGFAEGGVVFGPTMGMIGEGRGTSRSNPEIVAPLDKLKGIIGGMGGNTNISGEFRIAGKDLVYVIAQNNQSQRRQY